MQEHCPFALPSSQLRLGQVGRLACWLSQRTQTQAAGLVTAALLMVTVLDFATYDFELCIATLYIVPVTLGCWLFGKRSGIAITVGVTLVAVSKYPILHDDPTLFAATWNGAARAAAFAILAAIVLSFRHSYDVAKFLARHDRMTGALNKEAFNDQATHQLEAARFTSSPLLMILLDLDGFKAVNDRDGHEAGDDVLQAFSSGAARELRANDCFGRVGGDEFALLLPVGSSDGAGDLANDLHRRLIGILSSTGYPVTCSIGALLIPPGDAHTRRELMREADRLMYKAKRSGKNRVVVGSMGLQPVQDLRPMPEPTPERARA